MEGPPIPKPGRQQPRWVDDGKTSRQGPRRRLPRNPDRPGGVDLGFTQLPLLLAYADGSTDLIG